MQHRVKYRIEFNGGNHWYLKQREEIKSAVKDLKRFGPRVFQVIETLDEQGQVIETNDIPLKEEELK